MGGISVARLHPASKYFPHKYLTYPLGFEPHALTLRLSRPRPTESVPRHDPFMFLGCVRSTTNVGINNLEWRYSFLESSRRNK